MKKHIIVFVFTNSENEKQGLESLKYIRETKESILNTISKNNIVEPLIFSNNESFEEIVDKITEHEHRDRIVGFHFHGHANTALMWINDEKINARPFNEILKTLKSLKFAFFCGCQTKAQAQYLKKTDILTISTSNEVNEEYAKDISIEFYKHFIAEKNTFKDSFDTSLNIILAKQNPSKDFHQAEALNDLKSDYGIAGKNTSLTFEELIDSDKDFVIYKNTYFRTNINEYKKYYSRNFHARKKELKFINQGFSVEVPEKILLSGGGGSGKTTLALEYIKQNTGAYSNILVIDANDIKGSLSKLIQNADIENIFDNLRFLLNKEKHNTLLFFDNFDNSKLKDDFASCFWYDDNKPNIHVLVTSRLKKSTLKVFNDFSTVELEYFNEKEAVDFLYAQLPHINRCEDGENSIAQAKILAKDILDGMPMAIEMTAGLIKSNNLSFNAIVIDYKNFNPQKQIESIETKEGLITKMDYDNDKDKGIIKYLWKRNIELLSTTAIELLQLSSFLYNRNIPVHDILHPAYSHLHKNTNKTEFYGILDSLKEYNLVKSDDNNEFISIHALLQEVILAGIQEEYEGKQVGFFENLKFYFGIINRGIKLLHYGLIFTKVFKQKYKNNYFVSFNDITRYGNNLISFVSDFRRVSPIKLKSVITKNYDTQTKILNFIDIYKVNRKGKVTTKYSNVILNMLSKAANNKIPDALYDSSLFITEFSKKFEYLKYAARAEHILAQYDLGMIYNNGNEHLDKNEEKAFYWVEKSAEKGFSDAQCKLGFFYFTGLSKIEQNYKKAFRYFLLSAQQRNIEGQYFVGISYLQSKGVCQNLIRAEEYLKKAYEKKHLNSGIALSVLYYYGNKGYTNNLTMGVNHCVSGAIYPTVLFGYWGEGANICCRQLKLISNVKYRRTPQQYIAKKDKAILMLEDIQNEHILIKKNLAIMYFNKGMSDQSQESLDNMKVSYRYFIELKEYLYALFTSAFIKQKEYQIKGRGVPVNKTDKIFSGVLEKIKNGNDKYSMYLSYFLSSKNKDYDEYLMRSADLHFPPAMHELGKKIIDEGDPTQTQRAYDYIYKAALSGVSDAATLLANKLYQQGRPIPTIAVFLTIGLISNNEMAKQQLIQINKFNKAIDYLLLGLISEINMFKYEEDEFEIFEKGFNETREPIYAIVATFAQNKGIDRRLVFDKIKEREKQLEPYFNHFDKECKEAVVLLESMSQNGFVLAKVMLGYMNVNGVWVPRNIARGRKFLEEAYALGNDFAGKIIGDILVLEGQKEIAKDYYIEAEKNNIFYNDKPRPKRVTILHSIVQVDVNCGSLYL